MVNKKGNGMKKIILVTGGARSGKSTIAEKILTETENSILYLATSVPFDDEMKDRIKKHQERSLFLERML